MTEDYPRFPDIHDLHIEFEDQQKIMVNIFLGGLNGRKGLNIPIDEKAVAIKLVQCLFLLNINLVTEVKSVGIFKIG